MDIDILEELKNTHAHISLAQLLDVSNLLCTDVTKSFRRIKPDQGIIVGLADYQNCKPEFEIVNNPNHDYNSKEIKDHYIAVVKGLVNDASAVF